MFPEGDGRHIQVDGLKKSGEQPRTQSWWNEQNCTGDGRNQKDWKNGIPVY